MNPDHQAILAEILDLLKERLPNQALLFITAFEGESATQVCSCSNMTMSGQLLTMLEISANIVESISPSETAH